MVVAKLTWSCCRNTTRPKFLQHRPSVDAWFMSSAHPHSEGRKSLGIIAGCTMNDKQANQCGSVAKLHPVSTPPIDENTASMIDLLMEHLRLAREGKLRSLAVVSVSADGSAMVLRSRRYGIADRKAHRPHS
jgi:hypothetical protein